jgi:hypothetical protein
MIDNVALDVVIGLVFIYLLYSLFATILMEIISSSFGLRARNLSYALRRMLMDEKSDAPPEDPDHPQIKRKRPIQLRIWSYVKAIFFETIASIIQVSGRTVNMKNPGLYERFFNQPSIRTLSSGGLNNKPSYLSPDNFTKALMDSLKENTPDVGLLASVEEGIANLPVGSETKRYLQSLLNDSNYDLVKFKILLEDWYNDTMDRATGWFKRSVRVVLIIIGFGIAIGFNVDSLAIIKKLSIDKDAREQLVSMATDYVENKKSLVENIRTGTTYDSTVVAKINQQLDSLQIAVRDSLYRDMHEAQTILSLDWNVPPMLKYDSHPSEKHKDYVALKLTFVDGKLWKKGQVKEGEKVTVAYTQVHRSVDPEILMDVLSDSDTSGWVAVNTLRYKIDYVFSGRHFAGYLLTVLALSLGAPFWFDILNKLVKLRTSSKVATESASGSGAADRSEKRAILNRAG